MEVFEFVAARAHGNALDGHEGGGGAGGHDFVEGRDLVVLDLLDESKVSRLVGYILSWMSPYRSALDVPSERLGDSANTVAGDTLDNVLAVGDDNSHTLVGSALDTDEAGGGELINLSSRLAVQVQGDAVALAPRLVAESENRRVVASNFGATSTIGRRTVKVLKDEGIDGVDTVVDTRGHNEHDESVLFRRAQPQLCAASEQKRANVHGSASTVGRDEFGVQADRELDAMLEMVGGDVRDGDGGGGVLHALSILLRAEDVDGLVVRGTVSLQTLVALLAVVEARRHAMDTHEGRLDKLRSSPFAGLDGVGGFDVAVD